LDGVEDINNNGTLDVISFSASEFGGGLYLTEDRNGNGELDPDEDTIDNDRLDGGTIESGVRASVVNNRLVLSSLAGGSTKIDLRDDDNILLQLGFFELNLKGLPIQKEFQFDADQLLVKFPSINLNVTPRPALVEVDITRGNLDPLPIAISPLHVELGSQEIKQDDKFIKNIGEEISKVIEVNFRRSGLFNPLKKDSFVQNPDIAHVKPRFEDWRLIKAQALVTGKANVSENKLRVEFRLWDVVAAKEMIALAFSTTPDNWRRVAHIISDKVYERLTGEEGYFDTRIIYVSETGPKTQRYKKLAIMDQDGANVKYLTLGNELVLTPRFSPKNQLVTYLSYFRNLPRVYLLDIETGVQEAVGDFPGMTFAPRFSPDGKKIIMSFAKDGNSDIYTMNMETRVVERITNHSSIDTSPSYSPDGKYICFNYDN